MCSETTDPVELNHTHSNSPQPWWRNSGYDAAPSSVELSGSGLKSPVESDDGIVNERVSVDKEGKAKAVPLSGLDGNNDPEHQHLHNLASAAPPAGGEYAVRPTEPELVGHSIACASYPYYGGLMAAYGPQVLVHPHLLGMHPARMPLPLDMADEPVYVNPKQYNGIMRRRQSRAKAELEKKLIKVRKPYLHESRHQHALRRQRGCGGRFLNKKELNKLAKTTPEEGTKSSAAPSNQSANPSGSAATSQCTGKLSASNDQEVNEDEDGNSGCQHHQDFNMSQFQHLSGETREEGDCSGQLRGNILVRQASQRALAIQ